MWATRECWSSWMGAHKESLRTEQWKAALATSLSSGDMRVMPSFPCVSPLVTEGRTSPGVMRASMLALALTGSSTQDNRSWPLSGNHCRADPGKGELRGCKRCPSPSQAAALGRVRPEPCLDSIVMLALQVWVQVNQPQRVQIQELTLSPADGSIGWSSWFHAGELTLMVQIRKIQKADQLS